MPAWLLMFTSGALIASLVFKVLTYLGLGLFLLVGLDTGLDQLTVLMEQNFNALPLNVIALLKMSGIYTIMHWIISAYAFRLLISAGKGFMGSKRGVSSTGIPTA